MINNIWTIPSTNYEPITTLCDWEIRTAKSLWGEVTEHLVGTDAPGHGRVSSMVLQWLYNTEMCLVGALTKSGREYRLVGNEGHIDEDAAYVWRRWLDINKCTDVTGE